VTITKNSCRQSISKLIKNNVAMRTIIYLKVLRGLNEHAGRFFNLSFIYDLRFALKKNPMSLQTHPSFVCVFQTFQNNNSELKIAMCCIEVVAIKFYL
jgi:hypothetical protein